jgi:hypothetical protein
MCLIVKGQRASVIHEINWSVVIVQAIAQILVLGSVAIGYVVVTERWKGGVDANLSNLTAVNITQAAINERLAKSIEKLSDSLDILSSNQAKVISLLEYHIADDKLKFNALQRGK